LFALVSVGWQKAAVIREIKMRSMKFIGGVAAATLLSVSTAAAAAPSANPAASLSVGKSVRAAAPAKGASKIGAEVPGTTLISIGILAALTVAVLVATGGSDDSDSN
jgi:hypothetical protein